MINLTRINRVPLVLNSDLIEYIEKTPDEIVGRVVEFRRCILQSIFNGASPPSAHPLYPFSAMQRIAAGKSEEEEE